MPSATSYEHFIAFSVQNWHDGRSPVHLCFRLLHSAHADRICSGWLLPSPATLEGPARAAVGRLRVFALAVVRLGAFQTH